MNEEPCLNLVCVCVSVCLIEVGGHRSSLFFSIHPVMDWCERTRAL